MSFWKKLFRSKSQETTTKSSTDSKASRGFVLRVRYPDRYEYFDPKTERLLKRPEDLKSFIGPREVATAIVLALNKAGFSADAIEYEQAVCEHEWSVPFEAAKFGFVDPDATPTNPNICFGGKYDEDRSFGVFRESYLASADESAYKKADAAGRDFLAAIFVFMAYGIEPVQASARAAAGKFIVHWAPASKDLVKTGPDDSWNVPVGLVVFQRMWSPTSAANPSSPDNNEVRSKVIRLVNKQEASTAVSKTEPRAIASDVAPSQPGFHPRISGQSTKPDPKVKNAILPMELCDLIARGDCDELDRLIAEDPWVVSYWCSPQDGIKEKAYYQGGTALHWAVGHNQASVAELLIDRGAQINAKGYYGWTPLHLASLKGYDYIIGLLLSKGAEVNCKSSNGKTPLHVAASSKNDIITIELLLRAKAHINDRDNKNQTPLAVANTAGNKVIAEMLRKHGGQE